jgi:hypothetical protein
MKLKNGKQRLFPITLPTIMILILIMASLQCTTLATYKVATPDPGLTVTTKTDKQEYLLRQKVIIEGNMTLDDIPATNLVVTVQINNPLGYPAAFRTLRIGTPTQAWPIDITGLTLKDAENNLINTARTGTTVVPGITLHNPQLTSRLVYGAITVFDANTVPIAVYYFEDTIDPGSTTNSSFSFQIPSWACSGKALIVGNVYSQEPKTGGIALSLEKTAYYCISRTEQGLMDYPSLPPPPPQTTPGAYKTNITLPPDPKAGTYNVHVLGQAGPITFSSATTTFTVEDSTGYPPQASFAYWPAAPYLNMTVNFDASSSTAEGFNDIITSYKWNFNDGTPIQVRSTSTITHNFQQAKTFIVTLNVTDSEGLWSTTSKPITIYPEFGPTANFTWTPAIPYINQTITFDASNSKTGWCANTQRFSPIQTYAWNFSDGTGIKTVTTPTTTHNFTQPGNYRVTLKITDADGRYDTVSTIIQVLNVTLKMYDVDHNGKIDLSDVLAVAIAFGSFPGHPKWNPACDFDHNDKIDLSDYLGVVIHYGEDP